MEHALADLVSHARETTAGDQGSALVLVMHRLRRQRPEDEPARGQLAGLPAQSRLSIAVNPRTVA